MRVRATIGLPLGTQTVPLKDVPDIFARALYPDQRNGSWRVLLGFKKRLPAGGLAASFDNLEQALDDNDWASLDRVFDAPPPFRQRIGSSSKAFSRPRLTNPIGNCSQFGTSATRTTCGCRLRERPAFWLISWRPCAAANLLLIRLTD
jgi:hypothetical protein